HLRTLKKSQWIEEAWRTIGLYMERLQDPKVVERTSAKDSVIVVGTLQDKILKARELDLKQQEIDLKRQEVETPTENRVVIINDVAETRKALEDDDSDNGSDLSNPLPGMAAGPNACGPVRRAVLEEIVGHIAETCCRLPQRP